MLISELTDGKGNTRVAVRIEGDARLVNGADSVYVNFLDSDDDTRVREAYGKHTYRRLAEVKAKYDPDNAFHHNKNIRPDESGVDRRVAPS